MTPEYEANSFQEQDNPSPGSPTSTSVREAFLAWPYLQEFPFHFPRQFCPQQWIHFLFHNKGTFNTVDLTNNYYSFSSERKRAPAFRTLMSSCCALSTICFLFLAETLWAISAAYVLLDISSTSNSFKEKANWRSQWHHTSTSIQCTIRHPFTAQHCLLSTGWIRASAHASMHTHIHTRTHTHRRRAYLDVAHGELEETIGKHVLCLLVRAVTYTGHETGPTEPTPHTVVNALRLPPAALQTEQRHDKRLKHTHQVWEQRQL